MSDVGLPGLPPLPPLEPIQRPETGGERGGGPSDRDRGKDGKEKKREGDAQGEKDAAGGAPEDGTGTQVDVTV